MARLGCHCGADMTNTDGPSPHRLNVLTRHYHTILIFLYGIFIQAGMN